MLKRVYVWEFPVRWSHWLTALSIVMMSVTGYYIGNPFIHATSSEQFIMGWMRLIHFIAAAIFNCDFLLRIYWAFAGNEYASWRAYNPFSIQKLKDLWEVTKFYFFLKKEPPPAAGHSACAAYIYLGLFILFGIQILTGFALYSQGDPMVLWMILGGWLFYVIDAQDIRLIHHLVMWPILAFVIAHVYCGWIWDRTEKSGLMSSIFTGYKTMEEE